jgi:hypothetical protein
MLQPLSSSRVKLEGGFRSPARSIRRRRRSARPTIPFPIPIPRMLPTVLRSRAPLRALHTARVLRNQKWAHLTNILASEIPPPVQVKSITTAGVLLQDGRLLPSACIFLEGEVLLWDVPPILWKGWDESKFEVFDVVVPKPGASSWQTHRSKERLERAVVSLSARDLADWYGKICQPVASCFATISKQVRDSGRCHGLGGRRVFIS